MYISANATGESGIATHIKLILVITGVATVLALGQCVAPSRFVRLVYGQVSDDAASLVLARHWGLLIGGVGLLLIYAAFQPPIRVPIMVFAVIEKVVLGASILGTDLRKHALAVTMAIGDLFIALVYVLYLAGL